MKTYTLGELNTASVDLTPEQFKEQYSFPFLLHEETESAIEYDSTQTMGLLYMPSQVTVREAADWSLYEVRRSHESRAGAISVGRIPENDISIQDPSISKVHATVTVGENGASMRVTDVGSTNGTHFRGKPMKPHSSVEIKSGGVVTFGRIPLRFVSVEELFIYLKALREEKKLTK